MSWFERLSKMQAKITRSTLNAFFESIGVDPDEVAEIRVYPDRVILTRYLFHEDGARLLDHLGPRTAETYFHVNED